MPRNKIDTKFKHYFFCARIHPTQLKKLNAIMYTSESSHAVFLNGILDVFDMFCRQGQEHILREIFGNVFYMKFFHNYLDNLCHIENKAFEEKDTSNG